MKNSLFSRLDKNRLLILALGVCLVTLVAILPNLLFRLRLGEKFEGVYFSISDNEALYAARVRAVYNGNSFATSPMMYEYRNGPYLQPWLVELLFGLVGRGLNVSVGDLFLLFKLVLPAVTFLIIWRVLTKVGKNFWIGWIGAWLTTVGWELVAFPLEVIRQMAGNPTSGASSIYFTRPIHPLGSGIIYFLCLYLIYLVINKGKKYVVGAGVILGILIYVYFYFWTHALVILVLMVSYFVYKKQSTKAGDLLAVLVIAAVISIPNWLNLVRFNQLDFANEIKSQMGLVPTRQLVFPKLQAGIVLTYLAWMWRKSEMDDETVFGLMMLMSYGVVVNQQVASGLSLHPGHYQWLSNPPLLILTGAIVAKQVKLRQGWKVYLGLGMVVVSLLSAIQMQVSAYEANAEKYEKYQRLARAFDWMQKNIEKDAVVLAEQEIADLIPYYSDAYLYTTINEINAPIPGERLKHNSFVRWRLRGWCSDISKVSLIDKKVFVSLFGFADRSEIDFRQESIRTEFNEFCTGNLDQQLRKYKLDYVLVSSLQEDQWREQGGKWAPIYEDEDSTIFRATGGQ